MLNFTGKIAGRLRHERNGRFEPHRNEQPQTDDEPEQNRQPLRKLPENQPREHHSRHHKNGQHLAGKNGSEEICHSFLLASSMSDCRLSHCSFVSAFSRVNAARNAGSEPPKRSSTKPRLCFAR